MLPTDHFALAHECKQMHAAASAAVRALGSPPSNAWHIRLRRELARRYDELSRFEMSGKALAWNFVAMLIEVQWEWRSLEPPIAAHADLDYSPWSKPVGEFTQADMRDAIRALTVRWSRSKPEWRLWDWIDALERRAADLATLCDSGNALDEDFHESHANPGTRFAATEFVVDMAMTFAEMSRARFVHRDLLSLAGNRAWAPPKGMPMERMRAWLDGERDRLTTEARENLDEEIAGYNLRPGEAVKYASVHQGVIPEDAREILRKSRPLLSDYRMNRDMEPYLVFDQICRRSAFAWRDMSMLTESTYYAEVAPGVACRDVMRNIAEPTVVRIMGNDYVFRGGRAWLCADPYEAICLWTILAPEWYQKDSFRWDLRFLKKLEIGWTHGVVALEDEPTFA